jgi:hypothetical protein
MLSFGISHVSMLAVETRSRSIVFGTQQEALDHVRNFLSIVSKQSSIEGSRRWSAEYSISDAQNEHEAWSNETRCQLRKKSLAHRWFCTANHKKKKKKNPVFSAVLLHSRCLKWKAGHLDMSTCQSRHYKLISFFFFFSKNLKNAILHWSNVFKEI